MNLEVETKLCLTRDGYERLLNTSRIKHVHDQVNVYYDTADTLAAKSITLRVRYSADKPPVLTMKVPTGSKGHAREMFELDEPCATGRLGRSVDVASGLPKRFREPLRTLGLKEVYRIGWMRTRRTVVDLPDAGEVELDRVSLPDGTVYFELEVESPDPITHRAVTRKIRTLVGHVEYSPISKYQRFLQALRRSPAKQP